MAMAGAKAVKNLKSLEQDAIFERLKDKR